MSNLQSFTEIKNAIKYLEYSPYNPESGAYASYELNGEEKTFLATPEQMASELKRQNFILDYSDDLMCKFEVDDKKISIGIEEVMKNFDELHWKILLAFLEVELQRMRSSVEELSNAYNNHSKIA